MQEADAVGVGAGAGLSASAGLTYSGERFERYFGDFIKKYHFPDMYAADFDKQRLFYTQGDYGLWQCSQPCSPITYDNYNNEQAARCMVAEQRDMRVPTGLLPRCPVCGRPMAMNLRADDTFVEDEGWHAAAGRYADFLNRCRAARVLYLELGVGGNTPGIIKYPFWKRTRKNPRAIYACVNLLEAYAPGRLGAQALCIQNDIDRVLEDVLEQAGA